jgi:cation transport regulator ChaC
MSGVWIFGYGSLVWRPAFPYLERRAARISGWSRRFWQSSMDHRGTPEAPGRVVTLVETPGASLWGMCHAVAAAVWPEVAVALDLREAGGYLRVDVIAELAAAEVAGPIVAEIRATMYLGPPDGPQFIGPEPRDATAAVIRTARGPSGDNVAYVRELQRALAAMNAHDPEVDALAALL